MSQTEQRTAVDAVAAWHRAVDAQDIEGALALCSPDVAVTGPHGTGHGPDIMRAWLQRSGIRLEPQHELREVDGHVLVHEKAQWTVSEGAPAGAPTERPVDTWVLFRAASGVIESVARYETEEDALRAVALS